MKLKKSPKMSKKEHKIAKKPRKLGKKKGPKIGPSGSFERFLSDRSDLQVQKRVKRQKENIPFYTLLLFSLCPKNCPPFTLSPRISR
jgi:hypothetical protein